MSHRLAYLAVTASCLLLAGATLALHSVALGATITPKVAPPTQAQIEAQQSLFRKKLLDDPLTASSVRAVLTKYGGFVNPNVVFADLTGDKQLDAVVTVTSAGAAGDIAAYVFSSDRPKQAQTSLRAVFRAQALYRARILVKGTALVLRSPRYVNGNDLCCPSRTIERFFRWNDARSNFRQTAAHTLR